MGPDVDDIGNNLATFNVPQKLVPKTAVLMRANNQARDVSNSEAEKVGKFHHALMRVERCKRIRRHLQNYKSIIKIF